MHIIDSLAGIISCEVENCMTIADTITAINHFIYEEESYFFVDDCDFISNVIDRKCGNCASFTAFYLSIAERLGIKYMYAVLAPNHVFVRYEHNGIKINIETTQKGENYCEQCYLDNLHISDRFLHSDTYFRNLSKSEFLAVLINNRGNNYAENGQLQNSLNDHTTVLSIFPTLTEAYFGLAKYYEKSNDKQKAIELYNKVISNNPEFVNAYCNRGFLYDNIGQYELAINDFDIALKLNPDFAEVYYNRGITFTNKKDYQTAINDFTTAIKIKPGYKEAYYNLGCVKYLAKEYFYAITDFNKAIEFNYNLPEAFTYRGDCKSAIGDKQGACEDWKKGFELGYNSTHKKRILRYCNK